MAHKREAAIARTADIRRYVASTALALLAVFGLARAGSAQEELSINGSVYIAGRPPLYPPPHTPRNTHAYLTVRGKGAVLIYRTMSAAAEADACRGNGWKIKRAGDFACSISGDGAKAECDFSIELRRGVIAPGSPC